MNTNAKDSTAQLFLQMTNSLAVAEATSAPSGKVEHYQQASEDAKTIINRLALFGGAVFTGLDAIRNIVESLKEKNPVLYAEINRLLGRVLSLQDTFQVFYGEEAEFCTAFEDRAEFCERYQRALQRLTVVEAGVNPKAGKTALKRLYKVALLTQPAGAGN